AAEERSRDQGACAVARPERLLHLLRTSTSRYSRNPSKVTPRMVLGWWSITSSVPSTRCGVLGSAGSWPWRNQHVRLTSSALVSWEATECSIAIAGPSIRWLRVRIPSPSRSPLEVQLVRPMGALCRESVCISCSPPHFPITKEIDSEGQYGEHRI